MRPAALAIVLLVGCANMHGRSDAGGLDGGAVADEDAGGVDAGATDAGDCPIAVRIVATPTARAQIAVWLEAPDGRFETVALTAAVGRFGLGNRPGAQQLPTGYRWPTGRRLDALPRWAHQRLASGGAPFRTVVWTEGPEGHAAGHPPMDWIDNYYCMSFRTEDVAELDAVTCASLWAGEPGRYLTEADVDEGYAAPFAPPAGEAHLRPLALEAPYPPRRDLPALDRGHPDTARFAGDALAAMPSLDAVTMATPAGDRPLTWTHRVADDWPVDQLEVWVEVNTERDYNDAHGPTTVPSAPEGAWDHWAQSYGVETGGQPSTLYRVRPGVRGEETTATPIARTERFGGGAELVDPDDLTDDPSAAPGSGADRLRDIDGVRLSASLACAD